jgi:hypothetical protein
MNRRAFVCGSLLPLAVPLAAEAQQAAKIARVGFLVTDLATGDARLRGHSFRDCETSGTSRVVTS